MKNPLEKHSNTGLIVAVTLGTAAAAAIAFLYLTEKGNDTRKTLKKKIKAIAKDAAVKAVSKKTHIKKKFVKAAADQIAD